MPDNIFNVTSDTSAARKQLGLLLKPLTDLKDTGMGIMKKGGLFGLLMGKPQELSQFEKASKQLKDDLREQLKNLKSIQEQRKAATGYEDQLRLSVAEDKVAASVRTTANELRQMQKEFEKTGKVADRYYDTMEQLEDLDVFGGMGGMGFGFNPLQSASSLTSMLGGIGGGYEGPLQKLSESLSIGSQVGYELQPLTDGLKGVFSAVKGGEGVMGKFAGGIEALTGGAGAAGAAGVAAGLALSTLNMTMQILQERAEDAIAMREREIDAIRRQMELQYELDDAIAAGDYEGAIAASKSREREWQIANAEFEKARQNLADLEQRWWDAASGADLLTMGQLGYELDAAREVVAEKTAALESTVANVAETWDALPSIQIAGQIRELDDALAGLAEPTFLDRLTDAVSSVNNTRESLNQLTADFQDQMKTLQEDLEWSAARQTAERNREDTMELQSHIESQLQLIEDSRTREEEITAEFGETVVSMAKERVQAEIDALAQLNESLDDLADDYNKSRSETIEEYNESEIERTESHERDIAKMEDDYNRERVRRLEDLQSELNKAERANDVLAFIAAQEQGVTDLKRMKEDHDAQLAESEDAFELEQAQAKKEQETRLEDMRVEAEERRDELLAAYEKEKILRQQEYDARLLAEEAARDERLDAEKASLEDSLQQAQDAFDKAKAMKEEQREWDDTWAEKEQERQRQQQQDAYDNQREALETQLAAEELIIQEGYTQRAALIQEQEGVVAQVAADTFAQAVTQGIKEGAAAAMAAAKSSVSYSSSSSSGSSSSSKISVAKSLGLVGASPGVATDPTLSMLGERPGWGDLVIPFPNNQGVADSILKQLGQGSSSGGNNYSFYGNIDNGMTRSEITAMFKSTFEAMFQALGESVS